MKKRFITCYVTEKEYDLIKKYAELERLSLSNYLCKSGLSKH